MSAPRSAPSDTTAGRFARIGLEVAAWVVGFVVLSALARGLAPVAPALAGAIRAMLNPCFVAAVLSAAVLWRVGRGRRRPRPPAPP